jgi:hypothetical protein
MTASSALDYASDVASVTECGRKTAPAPTSADIAWTRGSMTLRSREVRRLSERDIHEVRNDPR